MANGKALGVVVALLAAGPAPAGAVSGPPEISIPYRQTRMVVDGVLDDWGPKAHVATFSKPPGDGPEQTTVAARLCWDRTALWVAFEVEDPHVHEPPPGVIGPSLFQWDSVEVYLDSRGNRAPRMDHDDFQVLISSDGRVAVLQGDPLLADFEPISVPKRTREGIAVGAATRRTSTGYVVEVALPFSAFGIEPRAGLALALDLAVNDWSADHPGLPMIGYDLATLNMIAGAVETGFADNPYDQHGLRGEAAHQFATAHYHPWAWSGGPDFGRPESWTVATLTGRPPFFEELTDRAGARGLLLLAGAAALTLAAAGIGGVEVRHRRQIARLVDRVSRLEDESSGEPRNARPQPVPPVSFEPRPASRPMAVVTLEQRLDLATTLYQPPDSAAPPPALWIRAVRRVSSQAAEPLTPADLAAELCVSLRTLQRELAGSLKCTPRELILAVKMREARALLLAGWRVQETASRVGFDDPAHFSRRFRAYFGRPPSEVAAGASSDSSAA